MNLVEVYNTVITALHFETWRDPVECLITMGAVYAVLTWLSRDKTKTFLPIIYTWSIALGAAHVAQLETVVFLMLVTAPLCALCLVLFHSEKLQKNFVLYKTVPLAQPAVDWIAHLMRSLLLATNKNQEMICFIERHDSLATLFTSRHPLHAPLTLPLMTMIQESAPQHEACVVWITQTGMVHGTELINHLSMPWIDSALVLSSRNDSIMIKNNPAFRTFEIVMEGKHITDLSVDHTLRLLRKALHATPSQGVSYDFKNPQSEQPSPLS